MEKTKIGWTDATFNAWWGCEKVSAGCAHCYAEAFAKRTGNNVWGGNAPRRVMSDKRWNEPLKWNKKAEQEGFKKLVFSGSMCDIFEDRKDLVVHRERLWKLIEATPYLIWQLLTKRPENILKMVPSKWIDVPPLNVWYGTTVENQEQAGKRIPELLNVPAMVRFLSCEPLLERISIDNFLHGINWVICGGESGRNARSFDVAWGVILQGDCKEANVPFFFKQVGSNAVLGGKRYETKSYSGDDEDDFHFAYLREIPSMN